MKKKIMFLLLLLTIITLHSTLRPHLFQLTAQTQTQTHNGYTYQITDWWNYDYQKRKPIKLNTSTTPTPENYQIFINLTYDTDMNSDFSDLRCISYTDNTTQLNYWIENQSNNNWCHLWIQIPQNITSQNKTHLLLYYQNPTANTQSNADSTFDFFDDFSNDLSKWTKHITEGVYPQIDSGTLLCAGGSTSSPYGFTAIGTNVSYNTFYTGIIEADIYPTTDALPEITFRGNYSNNTGYKGRWDCRTGSETPWFKTPYNGWTGFGTAVTRFGIANQWQHIQLTINTTTFQIFSNNTLYSTTTDTDINYPGEIALMNHYGTSTRYDNIRVRKYAQETPTIYVGPEQQA